MTPRDKQMSKYKIQKLVYLKTRLLQAQNPNSILSDIFEEINASFYAKKLNSNLYFDFMYAVFYYIDMYCIFKIPPNQKLIDWQEFFLFCNKSASALFPTLYNKKLKLTSREKIEKMHKKSIALNQGTATGEMIIDYIGHLLSFIDFNPSFFEDVHNIFCIIDEFLDLFLYPSKKRKKVAKDSMITKILRPSLRITDTFFSGKGSKVAAILLDCREDEIKNYVRRNENISLYQTLEPIIHTINNIIEEYIAIIQPSLYFFDELKYIRTQALSEKEPFFRQRIQ